ncbi:hypothetical protein GCM10009087_34260 [Sphingomonas oligophenolica]|uniref:DUF202 domain-containing protein n=1 Tax=Sphingomonas oligophenolica TaxID=301154 RepID=A0ABU9XYW2_9SPHN
MIQPPDLNDPAQRAAYRRELQGVARPIRYTGISFALLGVALALIRRQWFPDLPIVIPIAALGFGMLNMVAGIVLRTRYHQARMRG